MRESLVRALALEVVTLVMEEGWLADRAVERTLRRERGLHSRERRAVAEGAYGIIRRWRWIEAALEAALPAGGLAALPTQAARTLRYGAWLVAGEGTSPEEAARRAGPEAAPWADALGRLAPRLDGLGPVARLGIERSIPDWLAEIWIRELGVEEADRLAAALSERGPLTVRANTLKAGREQVQARLSAEGVRAEPTRFSPWGLILPARGNVFALECFKRGLIEVQDEGSQLLALLVGARPGEKVVDLCAGAGGKSLALAAMMENRGELVCADVDAGRLLELKKRARRAGVFCHRLLHTPEGTAGEAALARWEGRADRVLVDAPCSGTGALRRNPEARWRLRPEALAEFPHRQKEILCRAARLVRPGGRLVYATCALDRAENEDVAARFLAAHGEFRPLSMREALGPALADALGASETLTLLPHRHGTDGFFAAAFVRATRQ